MYLWMIFKFHSEDCPKWAGRIRHFHPGMTQVQGIVRAILTSFLETFGKKVAHAALPLLPGSLIGPYLCLIFRSANQKPPPDNSEPPASQATMTHTPCARRLTKVSDTGRHMSHWAQPPPNVCQNLQVHHVQNETEDSGWLATSVLDVYQHSLIKSYHNTSFNGEWLPLND